MHQPGPIATPIVEIRSLSERTGHRVFGKCEFLNINGSIKDRIGVAMLNRAEHLGQLTPGVSTVVDATGGNTGIALAAEARRRGYSVLVTTSKKVSQERVRLLNAWGAEVIVCESNVSPQSSCHFINVARSIARSRANHVFLDQFTNPANWRAHYDTTGPEIWAQMKARVDVVIGGFGTGGTMTGIGRYFRDIGARVRLVMADPAGSILAAAVEGGHAKAGPYAVEGIGGDFVPAFFERELFSMAVSVPDDEAFECCRRLQREEGLFVGSSSGCVIAAFERCARLLGPELQTVLLIFADGGRNYLEKLYRKPGQELSKLG